MQSHQIMVLNETEFLALSATAENPTCNTSDEANFKNTSNFSQTRFYIWVLSNTSNFFSQEIRIVRYRQVYCILLFILPTTCQSICRVNFQIGPNIFLHFNRTERLHQNSPSLCSFCPREWQQGKNRVTRSRIKHVASGMKKSIL